MTWWVFLSKRRKRLRENNPFNSLFFQTVIRIIYQMWVEGTQVSGIQNTGAKIFLSQSLFLNTSEGTNAAATVGDLLLTWCSIKFSHFFRNKYRNVLLLQSDHVSWVSKQMRFLEGLRCVRSKIEIWEAVLELKLVGFLETIQMRI